MAQGVVEALDVIGQTCSFANSLVQVIRYDSLISVPEVGKANALLEDMGDGSPKVTARGNASTPDNTGNHLLSLLTKGQPHPAFVGFVTHERPQLV